MKFKQLLCCFLIFCFLLTIAGCSKNSQTLSNDEETSESTDEPISERDYLTLLYSSADSFNPYTLKTDVNRQLVKLIYEPLVKVNDRFEAVNALANSVKIKGDMCTVTLKDAKFSDGTSVTAKDVVYSYNLAKNSETVYADKLYGVSSVSEKNGKIEFKLIKNDPYFANVLDFPIIKEESDTKTDADSVSLPPIGSGRYKLNETNDGLVLNEGYYGKIKHIKEIRLINAPDKESVAHYTEIGAADIYFTEISDGNITRMSAKRQEINLNNLIFIGINQNFAPLNQPSLRQAISSAVDRVKFCKKAYYNNAVAANGFFHPVWNETNSVQNLEITANSQITIENLEEIGYNKLNSDGLRVNKNGIPLKFTLLVNSENRIRVMAASVIADQLESVGIGITVVEKSYSQYTSDLKSGNFQLYLGEVKITNNMDFSQLLVSGGSAAYGLPYVTATKTEDETQSEAGTQSETDTKPIVAPSQTVLTEFYKGNATIKDVASVLQTDMAVVPLCYRTGLLFYNSSIENVKNSSLGDIYFSIESYLIK